MHLALHLPQGRLASGVEKMKWIMAARQRGDKALIERAMVNAAIRHYGSAREMFKTAQVDPHGVFTIPFPPAALGRFNIERASLRRERDQERAKLVCAFIVAGVHLMGVFSLLIVGVFAK